MSEHQPYPVSTNAPDSIHFWFNQTRDTFTKYPIKYFCRLVANEFLKVSDDSFIAMSILTSVFNFMLENGEILGKWSECIICPIFNSSNKYDCNNYRGISLLASLRNLFSSLLITRLDKYAITHGLYGPLQAVIRKGYRTCDNMFIVHSLRQMFRKAKKNLYCFSVDFLKTLDHVDHLRLWYELV